MAYEGTGTNGGRAKQKSTTPTSGTTGFLRASVSTPAKKSVPAKISAPAKPATAVPQVGNKSYAPMTPTPIQQSQRQSAAPVDNGTTSGLGVNSQGAVAAMSAPAAPTAQDNWNNSSQDQRNTMSQDDQYTDEVGNAEAEYNNLIAQLGQQKTNYEMDNKNSLRNLGDMGGGMWNQKDKLTGYGNAFQQQQGDFASRGMLESSGYGTALSDMNRGFDQQRNDIGEALRQFTAGQSLDSTQALGNRDTAKTQSQRQALLRMSNSLGL